MTTAALKPAWLEPLLVLPDRLAASLAFAPAFLAAPAAERAVVASGWSYGVEWEYPSPWRLACRKGELGSPEQRLLTTLVLNGLESHADARDQALVLGVAYNSARLAGLDPDALFLTVAQALPARAASALRSFSARAPQDKSLEAFRLSVGSGGEPEIRADW